VNDSSNAPNATIVRRRNLNERAAIVHVRPDAGDVADFVPGQFIQLGLPGDAKPGDELTGRIRLVKRSYSIASSPRERESFELFLTRVDDGKLTPRLWSMEEGARLWIDPIPKGFFTLERVPPGRDLVMVATGTGLAPFVSMLRFHRDDPDRFRRYVVVHGARERSDLAYDDELRAAQRSDPRVRYVPVLSRLSPADTWEGTRGHVQVALEPTTFEFATGAPLDPERSHVFLCGNPQMIEDVREMLAPRGFVLDTAKTPGNLHFERYW
jgi:ferredoxin--NADP+ reductase